MCVRWQALLVDRIVASYFQQFVIPPAKQGLDRVVEQVRPAPTMAELTGRTQEERAKELARMKTAHTTMPGSVKPTGFDDDESVRVPGWMAPRRRDGSVGPHLLKTHGEEAA